MTKSRHINTPRKSWTALEIAQLTKRYPNETASDLATAFGVMTSVIYAKARRLGLHKSAEFLASEKSGRLDGIKGAATRFAKGGQSWNAGMTGLKIGGTQTQFKPGQVPHNYTPIGTIRTTTKDMYWKVKVAEPNVWEFLHRHTWEAVNGVIPEGHALLFKDKNRNNCAIENLELVTRAELSRRNCVWHTWPLELKQVIRLNNKLIKEIKNATKQ